MNTEQKTRHAPADGKKYLWLLATSMPLLPLFYMWVSVSSGNFDWMWGPMITLFGVVPFLDAWIGEDWTNPKDEVMNQLKKDLYYSLIVRFAVIFSLLLWVVGAWFVTHYDLTGWQYLGLALSVGWVGNAGNINAAHELGHKQNSWDVWLARISVLPSAMGYFRVEHNQGHHAEVATANDTATSRYGENFWAFILREIPGGHRRSFAIENKRLQRKGKSAYGLQNEYIASWIGTLLIWGCVVSFFGTGVVAFVLISAAMGNMALSSANFVEHYGLKRKKMAGGKLEPCQPRHSWNSNRVITNLMFFHLQRHSDHHANAARPYQCLRHYDEAPQLPYGYLTMFLAAWFPPVWRRIMDPILVAHTEGDYERVLPLEENNQSLKAHYHNLAQKMGHEKC